LYHPGISRTLIEIRPTGALGSDFCRSEQEGWIRLSTGIEFDARETSHGECESRFSECVSVECDWLLTWRGGDLAKAFLYNLYKYLPRSLTMSPSPPIKSVSVRTNGKAGKHWSITVPERLKTKFRWKTEDGSWRIANLHWVDIGLPYGVLLVGEWNQRVSQDIEDLKEYVGAKTRFRSL